MNCELTQQHLLGLEAPDRPDADAQAHLDGCAACREWQGRLLQIEQGVRRLPVPGSATRDAFLLDLILPDNPAEEIPAPRSTKTSGSSTTVPPLVRLHSASQPEPRTRELAWRYRYGIAAAAAAVLLFAFASIALRENRPIGAGRAASPNTTDPLVAKLMKVNVSLVKADKQNERAEALARMADDLGRESQTLARVEGAQELVTLFTQLRSQVQNSVEKLTGAPEEAAELPEATAVADARRVKQLYRNRSLIQTLVEGGLRIAGEDDKVRRADSCSAVARGLALEIQVAASNREGDRVVEMGQHLNDLLQNGVAGNLRAVRPSINKGSSAEKELEKVRDWVNDVARRVEDDLRPTADLDRDTTGKMFEAVRGARRDVENAVRG
jgi:hypothetical protein